MKERIKQFVCIVAALVIFFTGIAMFGCSIQAKGTAYWPKENQDKAYLSRQAENGLVFGSLGR